MAAGAVGAFGTLGLLAAFELLLGCLLDVLGLRRMEPVRERATAGCWGRAWPFAPTRVMSGRSTMLW